MWLGDFQKVWAKCHNRPIIICIYILYKIYNYRIRLTGIYDISNCFTTIYLPYYNVTNLYQKNLILYAVYTVFFSVKVRNRTYARNMMYNMQTSSDDYRRLMLYTFVVLSCTDNAYNNNYEQLSNVRMWVDFGDTPPTPPHSQWTLRECDKRFFTLLISCPVLVTQSQIMFTPRRRAGPGVKN